jgi:hypothetical protein
MPPGPRDTNQLGCANVGGGTGTSRGSIDWVDALMAYSKKTRFGSARNRIRSSVNPHDALGDSGEDFPGDCPGLGGKFTGQDLLVALAAYEDYFLAWLNPV